jgi:pimeloyl-ACP methyl ester carboxylesterase
LALDFAMDHPEQVRSLTLIEPGLAWLLAATGSIDSALKRVIRHRMSCYAMPLTRARYARFLRETYGEEGYDPRRSPRWRMMCAYMGNMRFRSALFAHVDRAERLAAFRCPVLLIQGRNSDPFHRAVMSALRARMPGARFVEMPGGHVPHYGAGVVPFLRLLEELHASSSSLAVGAVV